uniref:Uncharacterized protein n=2 Tax=Setaria italica TaxID=4555 RepID=K3ZDQ3_SETIT
LIRRRRRLASAIDPTIVSKHAPPSASSNPSSSPHRRLASAIDPAIASKHAPPSASSNSSSSPLGWPPAQAEGSGGDTGVRRLLDWASSPVQDGPCGPGPLSSSPRAPAAGAGGSEGLSGGAPIFNRPSIAACFSHCSDEFSCYSGSSSSSSYSGVSARSCVSDSTRRGRLVDPLRVLSVVASLRRINPKMFAEAIGALFHSGAEKKRKGVWIKVDNYEDQSERSSAVASEGSTVTAATSAGSTATSGRCRRPPRASGGRGGGGEKAPRRAEAIMQWFSRSQAGPATENDICAAVGDNSGMSKAIRWLLKQEGGLRRAGTGGLLDPYVYM